MTSVVDVVVVAAGVTKSFRTSAGSVTPIKAFDLTLSAGQLVMLTGASGRGKTAIVDLLAGWEQPDLGSVTWPGAKSTPPTWSEVAVIPQTLALLEELTVEENITLPLRALLGRRPPRDSFLDELLGVLSLRHLVDRSMDQISVGEQQRVMIARALAARPAVILADEPTAHQDDRNAAVIVSLLAAATRDGAACLIATRQPALPSGGEEARVIRLS